MKALAVSPWLAAAWLLMGLATAALSLRRTVGQPLAGRLASLPFALLLWPFVLPALAPQEAVLPVATPRSGREAELQGITARLTEGWAQLGGGDPKERLQLEGFVARLRRRLARLEALELELPRVPPSVRERLESLQRREAEEFTRGLALLSEVVAQLTLLRFVEPGGHSAVQVEQVRIEGLLARMESLAELSGEAS